MSKKLKCPICKEEGQIFVRVKAVIDILATGKGSLYIPPSIEVERDISLEDQGISCFCAACGSDSSEGVKEMEQLMIEFDL